MLNHRTSGILLHPTSLPGLFGSGDFGASAYQFIDWLKSTGQTYWQMLPLGEVGPGNSPYMSCSAFAGNSLLIDLDDLAQHGWLSANDLSAIPCFSNRQIDYAAVIPFRLERLRRAAQCFFDTDNQKYRAEYEAFCTTESTWLDDFALFKTIEKQQNGAAWRDWPTALVHRDKHALNHIDLTCAAEIGFWKFCQWNFARQWLSLKNYAHKNGVHLVGDVPIFVAYQSSDVWANQALFELDESGRSSVVAGVPPDYFSVTGQLWGNPLYRWDAHQKTDYAWWVARLRHALQLFDLVRIDHFRGFSEYWEVPASAVTAIDGRWMPGPSAKLFEAFKQALGHLPIIAEDLGLITPDVIELRDHFNLPGMRILQFAFGDDVSNHFLPHHYVPNCIAYTGTHDNDTTLGWWNTLPEHERNFVRDYLHTDGQAIHHDMMRSLANSIANTVIFPLQDVLGLSGEHRMNYPGQADGNWAWRFEASQLTLENSLFLNVVTSESGRLASV